MRSIVTDTMVSMKRFFKAVLVILAFAALSSQSATAAAGDPITAEVSKANDIVQLATMKHDRKTMDAMITKDFVLVLTHGQIENRAAWLDDVADQSAKFDLNQTSNLNIHHYNDDTAVVIGDLHIISHQAGKLYDVKMRFIDVWVKQDGQWKWASSQVAHFPDPPKH
jgi:hypothetical protein